MTVILHIQAGALGNEEFIASKFWSPVDFATACERIERGTPIKITTRLVEVTDSRGTRRTADQLWGAYGGVARLDRISGFALTLWPGNTTALWDRTVGVDLIALLEVLRP
jgi:hypothetical protein